jgi:hypothetical protein
MKQGVRKRVEEREVRKQNKVKEQIRNWLGFTEGAAGTAIP